ncbi:MAG: hypothetical protein ABJE99_22195 [Roseobacter sp.]
MAHYGQLYDWLHRRSNANEPGTKVLGVEITERKYHTIQSLSAEVDIPPVAIVTGSEKTWSGAGRCDGS